VSSLQLGGVLSGLVVAGCQRAALAHCLQGFGILKNYVLFHWSSSVVFLNDVGVDGSGTNSLIVFGFLLFAIVFVCLLSELFRDSDDEEFVQSLLLVSPLSRKKHPCSEQECWHEDSNGVPSQSRGRVNAQFKHGPPVKGLEDPECDQSNHNTDVASEGVLVDTLIVSLVNLVVSVSNSGLGGSNFRLSRLSVLSWHFLSFFFLFYNQQINYSQH